MITREELRRLAQVESPAGCAVSFYFQPKTPQDRSHREETILVKDLVGEALRQAERAGNHQGLREDLKRVLQTAEGLYGNHSRGRAIFACQEKGIWLEMDVPPRLGRAQLKVNSRFHLRPLVTAQSGVQRVCIGLLNQLKGRIFEMNCGDLVGEELRQLPDLEFGRLAKTGRSDGYLGYEAGHRERHAEKEVISHYKQFADSLKMLLERDRFDVLLVGCHDEAWPELEPLLPASLRQRLQGRFVVDPMAASAEDVRAHAARILEEKREQYLRALVREVIGQAHRNSRGAVGLRHVLKALERQEVQTLVVGNGFQAPAAECTNCRHLDLRMAPDCAVCGQPTRELRDLTDALVDLALHNGAEIEFITGDPDLEKAGHIGALLRFRADQNTPQKVAV
jgi:peptide subunit release factor 1 (eRF1)